MSSARSWFHTLSRDNQHRVRVLVAAVAATVWQWAQLPPEKQEEVRQSIILEQVLAEM